MGILKVLGRKERAVENIEGCFSVEFGGVCEEMFEYDSFKAMASDDGFPLRREDSDGNQM